MINFEQMTLDFVPRKMRTPSQIAFADVVEGAQDWRRYEQWVRDVNAGKRTPPFNSSPEWVEATRRVAMGQTDDKVVKTDDKKPSVFQGAMEGLNKAFADLPQSQPVEHAPMFMDDKPILLQGYANGGRYGKKPFVVGEKGMELVVPDDEGGRVIPIQTLGGTSNEPVEEIQYDMPVHQAQGRELLGEQQTARQGLTEQDAIQPQYADVSEQPTRSMGLLKWGDKDLPALEEKLSNAMYVKKNKWKDFGYGLLQGLNNVLNRQNNPIRSWGEKKRDDRVAEIAPKIELLKQRQQQEQINAMRTAQIDQIRANIKRNQAADRQAGEEWEPIDVNGYVHKKYKKGGKTEPFLIDGKPVEAQGHWTVSPSGTAVVDRNTGRTKPTDGNLGKPKTSRITAKDITDMFPNPTLTAQERKNPKTMAAYNSKKSDIAKIAGAVEAQGALIEGGQTITRNELQSLFEGYRKDGKLDTLIRLITSGAVNVR